MKLENFTHLRLRNRYEGLGRSVTRRNGRRPAWSRTLNVSSGRLSSEDRWRQGPGWHGWYAEGHRAHRSIHVRWLGSATLVLMRSRTIGVRCRVTVRMTTGWAPATLTRWLVWHPGGFRARGSRSVSFVLSLTSESKYIIALILVFMLLNFESVF